MTSDPTAALDVDSSVCWTDGDMESDGDSGTAVLSAAEAEFKASIAREMALLDLMEKTGYDIMQENGQRKYGGPPPGECRDRQTSRTESSQQDQVQDQSQKV